MKNFANPAAAALSALAAFVNDAVARHAPARAASAASAGSATAAGYATSAGSTRGAVPAVELLDDAPANAPAAPVVPAAAGAAAQFVTCDTRAICTALAALRVALSEFPNMICVVDELPAAPTAAPAGAATRAATAPDGTLLHLTPAQLDDLRERVGLARRAGHGFEHISTALKISQTDAWQLTNEYLAQRR